MLINITHLAHDIFHTVYPKYEDNLPKIDASTIRKDVQKRRSSKFLHHKNTDININHIIMTNCYFMSI